jgi:hypothetical protein
MKNISVDNAGPAWFAMRWQGPSYLSLSPSRILFFKWKTMYRRPAKLNGTANHTPYIRDHFLSLKTSVVCCYWSKMTSPGP